MAEALLGDTIDIHGGGHDLIFPHHENELAQSVCAHGGKVFARYWLHNGFVNVNSEKMSKSIGNVLLVQQLLKQAPGEALRLALLTAHYRQPLDWTDDVPGESARKLDRLYGALRDLKDVEPAAGIGPTDAFIAALEDDLNTPMALAELFELSRAANKAETPQEKAEAKARLLASGEMLGLLQQEPEAWFSRSGGADDELSAEDIEARIAARAEARKSRNFAEADRLRDELAAAGVLIEDGAQGTRWRRA